MFIYLPFINLDSFLIYEVKSLVGKKSVLKHNPLITTKDIEKYVIHRCIEKVTLLKLNTLHGKTVPRYRCRRDGT